MREIVADLHIHTDRSDGCLTHQQLSEKAKKLNLEYISITDHDVLLNKNICDYFEKNGPKLITGVELSAYVKDKKEQYRKLDMLLFNYSLPQNSFFDDLKKRKTERRIKWIGEFIKKISKRYSTFSIDLIFKFFNLKNISEIHEGLIFGALKRLNIFPNNRFEIADFYDIFMVKEYINPEFIETKISLDELMAIQKQFGGFFSFAHPLHFLDQQGFLDVIPIVLDVGVTFIEAYHYKHSTLQTKYLLDFTANNNLGVTGGSDYHGRTAEYLGKHGLDRKEIKKVINYLGLPF